MSIIFILLTIFLFTYKSSMKKVPELKPGQYVSMPFEQMKKYTDERIEYIKKNKNLLNPYNKDKFDMITNAVKNAQDLDTYVRALITLPSFEVGYYPLLPLDKQPDDYMLFQYEQGFRGWYWVYGTFLQENGKNGCYFAYIIRVDLLPPDLRNKLKIPLGASSYYMISTGASVDGDWKYSKNYVLPGIYSVIDKNNFKFEVNTDDIKLELSGSGDNFQISSTFNNYDIQSQQNLNKFTSFTGNMSMKRPGFFNGKNGWAIGSEISGGSNEYQNEVDIQSLFSVLENQIVPLYYAKPDGRLPLAWIQSMRESMRTIVPMFNTHRMVKEYDRFLYEPAAVAHAAMEKNSYQNARELSHWKREMFLLWPAVEILQHQVVSVEQRDAFFVGEEVMIKAIVKLGAIKPEHVRVQAYFGPFEKNVITAPQILDIKNVTPLPDAGEGVYEYSGKIPAAESGSYGLRLRIIPTHQNLLQAHELRLITWA